MDLNQPPNLKDREEASAVEIPSLGKVSIVAEDPLSESPPGDSAAKTEDTIVIVLDEEENVEKDVSQLEKTATQEQQSTPSEICPSPAANSSEESISRTAEPDQRLIPNTTAAEEALQHVIPTPAPVEAMEIDDANKAQKRKIRHEESDNQGDSEEECMRPPKLRPRARRILHNSDQENDTRIEASQTVPGTSDGDVAQSSGTEEEKNRKVGRPKKHKRTIDPEEAEKKIMAATGVAPECLNEDLLMAMTASDVSAQALEYLEHIDMIRIKSGKLQGGLSGEMKKRKTCLESMVRALQVKAESKNDPEFLKHKLSEMMGEIKKYKKEEEKREREISELREIINELKRENNEMRKELRKMKIEVHRSSEERNSSKKGRTGEESPYWSEDRVQGRSHSQRESSVEPRSRSPSVTIRRPQLGGKSALIPEGPKLGKEMRTELIQQQMEALKKIRTKVSPIEMKQGSVNASGSADRQDVEIRREPSPPPLPQRKPRPRIISNIQLVPPRDSQAGNKN